MTEAGERLLVHSAHLLRQLAHVEADMLQHSEGMRGHVRMGVGSSLASPVVDRVVQEVQRQGVDITLYAHTNRAEVMYPLLMEGGLDFIITRERRDGWSDQVVTQRIGQQQAGPSSRPVIR